MSPDEVLLRTIAEIYDAAIEPTRWTACLSSVRDLFEGTGGNLLYHDHAARAGGFNISVNDAEALERYVRYYHQVDPWAMAMPASLPPGTVLCGASLVPRDDMIRTEFWTDFARYYGVTRTLIGVLDASRHRTVVLSVNRPDDRSEFDEQDVRILRVVIPHVQRAMTVQRGLHLSAQATSTFTQAADAAAVGIVVVDDRLHVVYANRYATTLVAQGDGLSIDAGGLRAATATLTGQLRQMIGRASAVRGQRTLDAPPVALALPRPSGRPAFEVSASPITRQGPVDEGWPAAAAIVIIVDPDDAGRPSEELLRAFFHLTPTEARVATALAAGDDVDAIAAALGRTRETVRWHTKRVLQKADCRSQAQFVRRATMGSRNDR